MQETRNKKPAASVYLLENLHFLQFFVADSVPGSIILCKGDNYMKDKPRNKKSIFVVLILLIFCAAYLAYDVAAGATPVLSFLFPTGAVLLFCIYMLLKQLRSK